MKTDLRSAIAALVLAVPGVVLAAGETDFKDIQIELTIPERIVVDQLDNIALSAVAGSDATGEDAFCVGGTGFSTYSIQFDSATGAATSNYLLQGSTDTLPYSVGFANDDAASSATGNPAAGDPLGGNARQDYRCGVGYENAKLFVNVLSTDWQGAAGGDTYSDTLTVTVVAE